MTLLGFVLGAAAAVSGGLDSPASEEPGKALFGRYQVTERRPATDTPSTLAMQEAADRYLSQASLFAADLLWRDGVICTQWSLAPKGPMAPGEALPLRMGESAANGHWAAIVCDGEEIDRLFILDGQRFLSRTPNGASWLVWTRSEVQLDSLKPEPVSAVYFLAGTGHAHDRIHPLLETWSREGTARPRSITHDASALEPCLSQSPNRRVDEACVRRLVPRLIDGSPYVALIAHDPGLRAYVLDLTCVGAGGAGTMRLDMTKAFSSDSDGPGSSALANCVNAAHAGAVLLRPVAGGSTISEAGNNEPPLLNRELLSDTFEVTEHRATSDTPSTLQDQARAAAYLGVRATFGDAATWRDGKVCTTWDLSPKLQESPVDPSLEGLLKDPPHVGWADIVCDAQILDRIFFIDKNTFLSRTPNGATWLVWRRR